MTEAGDDYRLTLIGKWFADVPDVLVPLYIKAVEIVIFDQPLSLFFIFAVL